MMLSAGFRPKNIKTGKEEFHVAEKAAINGSEMATESSQRKLLEDKRFYVILWHPLEPTGCELHLARQPPKKAKFRLVWS